MTDADNIFGSNQADIQIWIRSNPEIWIRIPDNFWLKLDALAKVCAIWAKSSVEFKFACVVV